MGIRCTTVAPETTNIRTEKREQKEDVTFFVYLFGKRPVSFSTIPKRAINITFLKSEESWLGLWVKHHQNPFTSFTCNFDSPFFFHPGSLHLISIKNISIYPHSFI